MAGYRPLQTADMHFQSGVPTDLPELLQLVLQAYFLQNTAGSHTVDAWKETLPRPL